LSLFATGPHAFTQNFGIYRELWTELSFPQNDLTYLTNSAYNPNWPNNPNSAYTAIFTSLETETGSDWNNIGQRLRTYIVPPISGSYSFWIASDDQSNLWLSSDDDPMHATLIASVSTWTSSRQWDKESNQRSAPIPLVAGNRYYLEVLMQNGVGGYDLAVQWQLPDSTYECPIPASRMQLDPVPLVSIHPNNTTVQAYKAATFTVKAAGFFPPHYQWQRGTSDIPGATNSTLILTNVAFTDNGATFRCVLSNVLGIAISSNAILTVLPDLTPPTLLSAVGDPLLTNVMVRFSEDSPLDVISAQTAANYTITNRNGLPLPVYTAILYQQTNVLLTTAPQTPGSNYVVVINT